MRYQNQILIQEWRAKNEKKRFSLGGNKNNKKLGNENPASRKFYRTKKNQDLKNFWMKYNTTLLWYNIHES